MIIIKTLESLLTASMVLFGNSCAEAGINHEQYYETAYNVRISAEVENLSDNSIETLIPSSGTTFALTKGLKSYFITNRHVIIPRNMSVNDGFTLHSLKITIGTDRADREIKDDKYLRLVAVDNDSDLVLLEYTANPNKNLADEIRWINPVGPIGKADLGKPVFIVGYYSDIGKFLEDGTVVSPTTKDDSLGHNFWTSLDAQPGVSGAPIYQIDSIKGPEVIVIATMIDNTRTHTRAIDIKEATGLLDRYLKNPKKETKYLEEEAKNIYSLIDK